MHTHPVLAHKVFKGGALLKSMVWHDPQLEAQNKSREKAQLHMHSQRWLQNPSRTGPRQNNEQTGCTLIT